MFFLFHLRLSNLQVWWPSYSQHQKRPVGSCRAASWAAVSSVPLHWGLLTACQAVFAKAQLAVWGRCSAGETTSRVCAQCGTPQHERHMDIDRVSEAGVWYSHFQPWRCPSRLDNWRRQPHKRSLSEQYSKVVLCFGKCSQSETTHSFKIF